MNVLIIENKQSAISKLKALLMKEKYDVFFASTSALTNKLLEETQYNLILLDIDMPENKGFEILKKIRHHNEAFRLPVVILGTQTENEHINKLLELGANDYIQKPYNEKLLQLKIRNYLQIQQAQKDSEHKLKERIKELYCIQQLSDLVEQYENIEDIIEKLIPVLQDSFQQPKETCLKITYNEFSFQTKNYKTCKQAFSSNIKANNKSVGIIEVGLNKSLDLEVLTEEKTLVNLITERLGHIIERLEQKKRYKYLFDTLNEAVLKADSNGVIIEANHAAAKICGYSKSADILGTHMKELYPNLKIRNSILNTLKNDGAELNNFEFLLKQKNGNTLWTLCNIKALHNSKGEYTGTLGAFRDISGLKKAEQSLKKSEEKYKTVFEKGLSAIIVADDKGNYLSANEAAANLFGYSLKELTSMNVIDLKTTVKPNAAERYKTYLKKGEETGEFDFIHKNGQKKIAMYRAVRIGPDFNLSMLFDITERKKTEQALIESEEKYKRLVNNTITMIAEVNTKTLDIMNCNPAFAKSLDKNVKDVIGQNIAKFYSDGTSQKRIEIIEKALNENKVQIFEDTQNGRYYMNNFIPYKSENLNYIQIVTYDITDSKINQTLKESEEALQLANERYQNAQEIGKVGNWEYNIKTRTFMASKQIMRIFGFPTNRKTPEIADIENCIVETERERVRQATIDLMEKDTSYNVEYEIIQRNTNAKRNILSIAQLVKDEKGNPEKISGVIQDITERKIIEEAFKEQHIYLEKLNNSLVNVVFTVRMSDRKIIYVNNSIQTIFGYSLKDCINNNTKFLYPNEDSYQEFGEKLQNAIKSNKEFLRTEHKLRRKNGEVFPAEITTTFLKENNHIKEVISIITDITERQKAEYALKESEERYRELNASKDKFFSIISHDLKNPFNAILGFSDLALENIKKKEYDNIYKYCEIINRTTKQGFNLLNNLLQWSQLQTGKINFNPNEINYSEIVENTINLMTANCEEKNIDLAMDISQKLMVFADKYMLETIIRNLLSNAIKFTTDNGHVIISAQKENNMILTKVVDSGVGLSNNNIEKLFKIESSFSTPGTNDEKGTGLGLILCKEFVEKHGGKIWVESAVGKGTKFSFTLKSSEA